MTKRLDRGRHALTNGAGRTAFRPPVLGFGVALPPAPSLTAHGDLKCSRARPRSSPARRAASAWASPRRSPREGANIILNGFGDAAEIEKLRAKLAAEHGVKVRYDGADLSQQDAIEAMMGNAIERIRRGRHPGQQRRHPVRRADRRVSGRQMERDHRAQPDRVVSHDPPRAAGDEGEEMGPDHQHRVGARAGREPVQVGVCRRQARHRRAHQDRGARSRRRRASR